MKNIQACNLTDVWKPGVWQERFDAAVGPEMARARVEVAGTSYQDCIARLTQVPPQLRLSGGPLPGAATEYLSRACRACTLSRARSQGTLF